MQNNRLQDIKQRRASKYDQSSIENELKRAALVQQYLDEIEQMTEAWIANPKLRSDAQKKAFLSDFINKSKTIGIESTVDAMLPCLINAFNSDQVVHPDLYETHASLLFANMTELIKFLGKNTERQKKKERKHKSPEVTPKTPEQLQQEAELVENG